MLESFIPKRTLLKLSLALNFFGRRLATCLPDLVVLAREAHEKPELERNHREFQRSPIIKTNSTLKTSTSRSK